MSAAARGTEACVATLLELGADVGAVGPLNFTALSLACNPTSLPVVRQLIAAGAAALPPGSPQARKVLASAVAAAQRSERGCGECAVRCGGPKRGDCADGLGVLRAVLAAGVREAVDLDGRSLAAAPVSSIRPHGEGSRISAEHALMILQTLRAGGVDVLARGPVDPQPVLHEAAAANAPAVVRWLVTEAGAPLEERDSNGLTPLLRACYRDSWAAAHALLDCGARVDVQSSDFMGWWPVLLAVHTPDTGCALLLKRMLAADRDSLLRRTACGSSVFYVVHPFNADALQLLLGSGLPHLAEAINAVAVSGPACMSITPLHDLCGCSHWDAALALLAAGARVDIAGNIGGRLQTVAEWARRSPDCKHRGVKLAIAARAREHAAQAAAAAAKGLPSGGAGSGVGEASAADSTAAGAVDSGSAASAAAADLTARTSAAAAATGTAVGMGKQAKGRKGRRGAASNRAEELPPADEALELITPPAAVTTPTGLHLVATDGSVALPAAAAATDAAASAAPNTSEDALAAGDATGSSSSNAAETPAVDAPCIKLPEESLPQLAAATGASVDALALTGQSSWPAVCAEGSGSDSAFSEPAGHPPAADTCAGDITPNTRETGAESGFGANTCEPGEAVTPAGSAASAALLQTAEPSTAADSAAATASTLLATLQDAGASAAVVRRHLAALSELARDPAAAAALLRQGVLAAVADALSRHGGPVSRTAGALLVALNAAAAEGSEGEEEEGSEA